LETVAGRHSVPAETTTTTWRTNQALDPKQALGMK
jgi:hypothetical protein